MGRAGQAAALRQIGRLPQPATKAQPAAFEPVEELRHAVGPVLRVEQRIGQPVRALEVGRLGQQAGQRMGTRQGGQRGRQVVDLLLAVADAQAPAVVLQQGRRPPGP